MVANQVKQQLHLPQTWLFKHHQARGRSRTPRIRDATLPAPRGRSRFRSFGLGSSTSDLQKLGRGLLQVKERCSFERFVALLIASHMDAEQLKCINEAFKKDGSISQEELVELVGGLTSLGASRAQKVLEELGVGAERIGYTDFLAGVTDLKQRCPMERDKLLQLAWQQFGPNRHGMVKPGRIQAALAASGQGTELPKEFLKEMRRSPEGMISWQAFRRLFPDEESCRVRLKKNAKGLAC